MAVTSGGDGGRDRRRFRVDRRACVCACVSVCVGACVCACVRGAPALLRRLFTPQRATPKVRGLVVGRYQLKTHVDFSAAHLLRGYDGPCARLHGHNYRLEVEVEATRLDEIGLAVDFSEIRSAARAHIADFDHRHLNEIPPFDQLNPTAENVAAVLFRRLAATLNSDRVRVAAVTLSESERSSVRYTEDRR